MIRRRVLLGLSAASLLAIPALAARDESVAAAVARIKRVVPFHRISDAGPSEIALGRRLYFDPRLSLNGKMSCADCHRPSQHFSDGRPRSLGRDGKPVSRNAPSLLNAAFYSDMFLDGRAANVEEASLIALQNPREMAQPLPPLMKRLAGIAEYASAFAEAYPGAGISSTTLGRALGAYVFAVASREDSAFDRFILEGAPLSTSALSGFLVFVHKANCSNCHSSRNLAYTQRYQNIGLAPIGAEDLGRYGVDPSPAMHGAFRATVLRNVALTAPYMHDGRFATLAEVIEFYDRGGDGTRHQNAEIRPLHLTPQEKSDLTAFLHSMTSSRGPEERPEQPVQAAWPAQEPAVLNRAEPKDGGAEVLAQAAAQIDQLESLVSLSYERAGWVGEEDAAAYCASNPATIAALPDRDREMLYACYAYVHADPERCRSMLGAYLARSLENCLATLEQLALFIDVTAPSSSTVQSCAKTFGLNNPRLIPEERAKACSALARPGTISERCAAIRAAVPSVFIGVTFQNCTDLLDFAMNGAGCENVDPQSVETAACRSFASFRKARAGDASECRADYLCRALGGDGAACDAGRDRLVAAACASVARSVRGGARASPVLRSAISDTLSWAVYLPVLDQAGRDALRRLHEAMLGRRELEAAAAVADLAVLRAGAAGELLERAGPSKEAEALRARLTAARGKLVR